MNRPKLSLDNQIVHMREDKGIKFNIKTEEQAKDFLTYNNYYFKIKAYAKNYEKYATGSNIDKYIDLEFAYMVELSTLDMHLRKFIIKMSLDIEHFLKVKLLSDVANNPVEDGYNIVQQYFSRYPWVKSGLATKKTNSFCGELICKYENNFAVWNLVEVLTFGQFADLYHQYYEVYPQKKSMRNLVFPIKCLRNAAAHNNCLLNSLRKPYAITRTSLEISNHVAKINSIPKPLRRRMIKNPFLHDFVSMLVVFDEIVDSERVREHTMYELHELIGNRFQREGANLFKNVSIRESFKFIGYVVDHYVSCVYN